ncbi:MAG TPA: hypothetical protein DIT50_06935 [Rhodocyclaceae bacterium]|nr:hypothetical protein [Rhodocyclaceae bacterium]
MTSVRILQQLPQLFRYADVQKFTGNANVFLTRALRNGMVERVAKGVYVNLLLKDRPGIEEVACFLRSPSYISCEWALNRHGILTQSPTVCTVVTLSTAVGAERNLSWRRVTLEFSHVADRLFNGFETREGFNLALPEKALLDTIYLRKTVPLPDELEISLLDRKRLNRMAEEFPRKTREMADDLIGMSAVRQL